MLGIFPMTLIRYASYVISLCFISFPLSVKAYDLGPELCGGVFGSINIEFSDKINSQDTLEKMLTRIDWIRKPFRNIRYTFGFMERDGSNNLYDEIINSYRISSKDGTEPSGDIFVPTGSEELVADELHRRGIIDRASHAMGGCGEMEISVFFIPDGDKKIENSEFFYNFIINGLKKFLSKSVLGLSISGIIQSGRVENQPVPPHYPVMEIPIVAASEISRDEVRERSWDSFKAVFRLVKLYPKGYAVMVYTTDFKNAPRSILRDHPPSRRYFRENQNRMADEFLSSAIIARFFGGSSSNCIADGLDEDENDDRFPKCDIDREYLTENDL